MDFASFVDPIWLTPAARESLDYDRDNGLRLGLGYRFASGWDVSWNYTYFQTSAAGAIDQAANPGLVLIATRSDFDLAVDSVAAQADLDYQIHDIEAGRRITCTENTDVRLFGGFRWASIDQSELQQYTYENIEVGSATGTIDGPASWTRTAFGWEPRRSGRRAGDWACSDVWRAPYSTMPRGRF